MCDRLSGDKLLLRDHPKKVVMWLERKSHIAEEAVKMTSQATSASITTLKRYLYYIIIGFMKHRSSHVSVISSYKKSVHVVLVVVVWFVICIILQVTKSVDFKMKYLLLGMYQVIQMSFHKIIKSCLVDSKSNHLNQYMIQVITNQHHNTWKDRI